MSTWWFPFPAITICHHWNIHFTGKTDCIKVVFQIHSLNLIENKLHYHSLSLLGSQTVSNFAHVMREREREIKFIGLFENRGHRGPYSPYKPFNHNLYIGIIIFPHIDNPQYTGYDLPKKKPTKIINAKKVRAPLIWQIIGEKDSGSVYMWI